MVLQERVALQEVQELVVLQVLVEVQELVALQVVAEHQEQVVVQVVVELVVHPVQAERAVHQEVRE